MSSVASLPMSAWPTGRKVAAGVFAVAGFVALGCAAVYLSAVVFLLLNKANPRQAEFDSIVRYWHLYADDAQLRKKLLASMVVSGVAPLIVLPGALIAAARPRRALHGDARFASAAEVARAGLTGGHGKTTQPSILIGRHRGKFLVLPGQLSVMLSAPTRSGKGVGVVIPNLLNWPDSVVVLDIKGENYDITAGYRAEHGQAVYAFSPFDETARSHRWNPLTAVRTSPLHCVGDPTLTVQCLLVNDEFTAMGRVGVITSAAAFLAGYNLRLLTVVQAMSQLDAVFGDKEARTFATNHGLQILYAPREQRDADEYSAMLGHFTERATSRGRSRSFSQHGHSSVSRNESEQRRALLLPQEFKELGSERLVVILENCKPILGEKIRYHRDKVFTARLRPAPPVPQMDMDLHRARVQQRWRYVDDELAPGEGLSLDALAHDISLLPDSFEGPPDRIAEDLLDFFSKGQPGAGAASDSGGLIEPAADDDGVLIAEASAPELTPLP
jgi:type IV secretory pathway TraG/TraD family ATPase VirD4